MVDVYYYILLFTHFFCNTNNKYRVVEICNMYAYTVRDSF